jgi:hypothetical protein
MENMRKFPNLLPTLFSPVLDIKTDTGHLDSEMITRSEPPVHIATLVVAIQSGNCPIQKLK